MTYVAADGPPDVDAKHAWAPATGSAPPVINDWAADPVTLPWIELKQITGWRSAPEADDNRDPATQGDGEIGYPGRLLGKTVVYETEIQATSREDVRRKVTDLVNGFGDRSGLGTMTVTPWSYPGGVVWQYQARVLSLDFDPAFTYSHWLRGPWRTGAVLSLRMLDPRFYTPNLAGTAYL